MHPCLNHPCAHAEGDAEPPEPMDTVVTEEDIKVGGNHKTNNTLFYIVLYALNISLQLP